MNGLRVLITNITLSGRTGTETYVRDLAIGLRKRGHTPLVYSTDLGDLARELRADDVTVVDDLREIAMPPDIIHGHHHPETMTALLHFPAAPALFFCHDRRSWYAAPPRFPRIRRYVAVDDNCRERLVEEHGIDPILVRVVFNAVDLERFQRRGPLPERPQRALVFSNTAAESNYLHAARAACAEAGIALDVVGSGVGQSCDAPERLLGQYDLVFAKARCALEAMAVGTAVVLCDTVGVGPLVTAAEWAELRRWNFGMRTLREPHRPDILVRQIARYHAHDALEVSLRTRDEAGLDRLVAQLEQLYVDAIAEHEQHGPSDAQEDLRAAADYLRRLTPFQLLRAAATVVASAHGNEARPETEAPVAPGPVEAPIDPNLWLRSGLCLQAQLESDGFRAWAKRMRLPHALHRKLSEYCFIAQALHERGLLQPGRRGLGFGVGREPLAALFAGFGCEIVATDLDAGSFDTESNQPQVRYRSVDMNAIPANLRYFDFVWSSCACERLGSIEKGRRFLERMTKCLKPGGVAVHTTEFNLSSNAATIDHNPSFVLFRQRDIEKMAKSLQAHGHHLDIDFNPGDGPADRFIDVAPYQQKTHLKLQIDDYVCTSIGLIVRSGGEV